MESTDGNRVVAELAGDGMVADGALRRGRSCRCQLERELYSSMKPDVGLRAKAMVQGIGGRIDSAASDEAF